MTAAEAQQAQQVTQLLGELASGDRSAVHRLLPLVYAELRRIASRRLSRERSGHTLQATALVHEAYLRLVDQRKTDWRNRAHFFGVAAQLMRHILLDYAKTHGAAKRGGGALRVTLDESMAVDSVRVEELLVLDEALSRLERLDPQQARVVELRYYGGLNVQETAEALGVSTATVKREWAMARAWLHAELARNQERSA
ncbi:MAG: sigma-70 family RNA polymerase sigma factor [Bryobacteraceae bacterium]|nr:sigma-70 family RNA polymerase sigma factor [Bryobacteraceae bacterium]